MHFNDLEQVVDSYAEQIGGLSQRQREIVASFAKGRTRMEIADEFHCSERTIDGHLQVIFNKSGMRSVREILVGLLRVLFDAVEHNRRAV